MNITSPNVGDDWRYMLEIYEYRGGYTLYVVLQSKYVAWITKRVSWITYRKEYDEINPYKISTEEFIEKVNRMIKKVTGDLEIDQANVLKVKELRKVIRDFNNSQIESKPGKNGNYL